MIIQHEHSENALQNQLGLDGNSSRVQAPKNDREEESVNLYDYNPNFDDSLKSKDGKLQFSVEN